MRSRDLSDASRQAQCISSTAGWMLMRRCRTGPHLPIAERLHPSCSWAKVGITAVDSSSLAVATFRLQKKQGKGPCPFLSACSSQLLISALPTGEHPRMGALDVCPFVPVMNISMEECVICAHVFGQRLSEELGVPGEWGVGRQAQTPYPRILPTINIQHSFYKSFTKGTVGKIGETRLLDNMHIPSLPCSVPVWRSSQAGEQENPACHPCWGIRGAPQEGKLGLGKEPPFSNNCTSYLDV